MNEPYRQEELMENIATIIGFGPRRPGSDAGLAVERWLEERFRDCGLADVRPEPVPVHRWEAARCSLVFTRDSSELPCSAVPYTAWTPPDGVHGRCMWIDADGVDSLQDLDLRGRIVVARVRFGTLDAGMLKAAARFVHDPGGTIPDGPLHEATWLIENLEVYYEALRGGAAAFVGWLADLPIDGCDHWVPYDGFLKDLPAVWVGREHGEALVDRARREADAVLTSTGTCRQVDSHNVVGVVAGRNRSECHPGETILLTTHHDAPFASAVEDASGLSVLLALARRFAARAGELERSLVFLAASGHFHGGIGSRGFVERHASGLLCETVAALGIEHIAEEAESDGRGGYRLTGRPEVRAFFVDGGARLHDVARERIVSCGLDRSLVLPAYLFGPEPPCDSAPFFTAGIPSLCHITGPLYLFDPHDTPEKVRASDLPRVATFFEEIVRALDDVPACELEEGLTRRRGDPPAAPPPWFLPPEAYLGGSRG